MENIVQMVTMGSLSFALMLSLKLIFLNRQERRPSLWLGLYVLLLAGSLSEILFEDSLVISSIVGGTYWLFGPVLLFYVESRTAACDSRKRNVYLHLIPCSLYYTLLIGNEFVTLTSSSHEIIEFLFFELVFVHILCYFIISFRILQVARNDYKEKSMVDRMTAFFLAFLVNASIVLFGASWLVTNITIFTGMAMSPVFNISIQLGLSLLILLIALFSTEMPSPSGAEKVY
jgi:hypothetical protein